MLLKSTVAAATLALTATIAPSAHAVDVPLCTIDANNARSNCTFAGPARNYRVTITNYSPRYAWVRATCDRGPASLFANAWDVEKFDQTLGDLDGGVCNLEVAADGGLATGTVYLIV